MGNNLLLYPRIKKIKFTNFRNIEESEIVFPNADFNEYLVEEKPSILGLYGQNGSGKTSVIMSLAILKNILSGRPLSKRYESCVRKGCDRCTIEYTINMYSKKFKDKNNTDYDLKDSFCFEIIYKLDIAIKDETDEKIDNRFINRPNESKVKLYIENESFKYRVLDFEGRVLLPKQTFVSVDDRKNKIQIYNNGQKRRLYTSSNKELNNDLYKVRIISHEESISFIFNLKFLLPLSNSLADYNISKYGDMYSKDKYNMIYDFYDDCFQMELLNLNSDQKDICIIPIQLMYGMFTYGRSYLHVIGTASTGITNLNRELPLHIWRANPGLFLFNELIILKMDGPSSVPNDIFPQVRESLAAISDVLSQIVPGLRIYVKDLQLQLLKNNEPEHQFEIVVERNGVVLPLKYESDGIRRIISILSLLIAAYNDRAFTVAIDEIDSGIFEFLLGEILSIMSDSAKGQLIFTSHNLRPLEVIPPNYLCFTTTNPSNRFSKLQKRGNSNLRDTYFRNIVLGRDGEPIYNPTDKSEIELALYGAGNRKVNND